MVNTVYQNNANSRDTYFSVHNIKAAHKISKGSGIKVGIIDWFFSFNENKTLYQGYSNITGEDENLFDIRGHGFMMATTLREIAPECDIYAINGVDHFASQDKSENEQIRVQHFEKSIDWAIENSMDILTYSNAAFTGANRSRAYGSTEKAAKNGIITTFIHNDSSSNIFPYGCFKFNNEQQFARTPDVNIYHMDYNAMFIEQYERYELAVKNGETIKSGNDLPYFSFSSMSPVLAGFVALMKSCKRDLTLDECKKVLIDTSYQITEHGKNWYDLNPCNNVVDITKALEEIKLMGAA